MRCGPSSSHPPRRDGPTDEELLVEWIMAFSAEALPHESTDRPDVATMVRRRVREDGPAAIWLWVAEGGRPLAMSGYGNPTGSGIRISLVYTPPAQRGRGYATALVASQSAWLLANGFGFCFLFTDLANPTSNAIYERIGYRQVAEAASYEFG
jgi:predicted GNAT family acetyltransferase